IENIKKIIRSLINCLAGQSTHETKVEPTVRICARHDRRQAVKQINGTEVCDTLEELLNPAHTALVVVDVQNDFCHADGHFAKHKNIEAITAMVPKWVSFVNAAQDSGIFTVFIQQLTLPHGRSDSPAWLRFKCRDGKNPEYTLLGSWGAELVEGLSPRAGDAVVQKFRPDAFVRTPL